MDKTADYVNQIPYSKIIETSQQAKERIKKHKKTNRIFNFIFLVSTLVYVSMILLSIYKFSKINFVNNITIATLSYILVALLCSFYFIYYQKMIQIKKNFIQFYSNKQAKAELKFEKHQSKLKTQAVKKQTQELINQTRLEKEQLQSEKNKVEQQISFAKRKDRLAERQQSRFLKEQDRQQRNEINQSKKLFNLQANQDWNLEAYKKNLEYQRKRLQIDWENEEFIKQVQQAREEFMKKILYEQDISENNQDFNQDLLLELNEANDKEFYELLQVQPGAEPEEIHKAYLKLAKQFHPDLNKSPDANNRMIELNRAREHFETKFGNFYVRKPKLLELKTKNCLELDKENEEYSIDKLTNETNE
ncbi:DnaJ domain-containing protein [Mycoplasma capricolum subsp. capricolum]|uniref:DnaJ domain-containing protein n=1 Tax=Mycoplasma capricolum TaxID=2095 RepID=UPI003DA67947